MSELELWGSKPTKKRVAHDSSSLWSDNNSINMDRKSNSLKEANLFYSRMDLWTCAITNPKGHFITFIATKLAMKNGWNYTKSKNSKENIDKSLRTKLERYNKQYSIKLHHTTAVILAKVFGQSLVIRLNNKSGFYFMVTPIFKEFIEYDNNTNEIIQFNPIVAWGLGMKQIHVKPTDCVLYKNNIDPMGNGSLGISDLIAVLRSLTYEENIKYGFSTMMSQRGISALQIKTSAFDDLDSTALKQKQKEYEDIYGDIQLHKTFFTGTDVEISNLSNATAGYDLDSITNVFSKDTAAGTGMGKSRVDGSERGMAMGNIADRDNFHDIVNEIQETFEPFLMEFYMLIDKTLEDGFELTWTAEVKLDEMTQAQVSSMNASTANASLDFLTYNQILEQFYHLDPVPNGDMVASKYIAEFLSGKEEKKENPLLDEENQEFPETNNEEPSDEMNPDDLQQKTEQLKELEKKPTPNKLKEESAKELLKKGDSYRTINKKLKKKFGSGYSNSLLCEMRKEIDSLKRAEDSIDPSVLSSIMQIVKKYNPKYNNDQARIEAIKIYLKGE